MVGKVLRNVDVLFSEELAQASGLCVVHVIKRGFIRLFGGTGKPHAIGFDRAILIAVDFHIRNVSHVDEGVGKQFDELHCVLFESCAPYYNRYGARAVFRSGLLELLHFVLLSVAGKVCAVIVDTAHRCFSVHNT